MKAVETPPDRFAQLNGPRSGDADGLAVDDGEVLLGGVGVPVAWVPAQALSVMAIVTTSDRRVTARVQRAAK